MCTVTCVTTQVRALSFNRWAESNDMVVLWPHEVRHGQSARMNDGWAGCWDSYGQTGPLYATKQGLQMQAVSAMWRAIKERRAV